MIFINRALNLLFVFLFVVQFANGQDIFKSIEKKFLSYKEIAPKERILLITDRDVYAPGDLIWFNATTYNINTPIVSELSKEVKIYLVDSRSFQLIRKTYNVENGNVNSFLKIPGSIDDGIYYLKGETSESDQQNYYSSKIVIKKNIIPKFIIKATFPKRDIVPGDQFDMLLEFQDYYSEPKRNVDYKIEFYDGDLKISENAGKVKKDGIANVNILVPSKLQSGKFSYRISAESKGAQATLSGKLPVLTEKIYIDFIPENGKIIHGIDANIGVFSYDAHGMPMSIAGDLFEDDKLLLSFTCDNNGLGSFVMTPEIDKSYQVQVRGPVLVGKRYDLPPVETKGIALKVISKNPSKASYKMINGYKSVRSVYLIGVSDGVIFWASEHEIDRDQTVEIDLSSASGSLAHMIALNAAEHIEGEHILTIPAKASSSIDLNPITSSTSIGGKNECSVKVQDGKEGDVIFSAVNAPWNMRELNRQNIQAIGLPPDIYRQLVFHSAEFNDSGIETDVLEKYAKYYVPFEFGWDRVLGKKGAFSFLNEEIKDQRIIENTHDFEYRYREESNGGNIIHINTLTDINFTILNPDYISTLYKEKKDRKPSYTQMLESGTAVLDVLKSIKPYNLQGSKIVFLGSANSINSQGGALIVVDGINRGTDASILGNLSPFEVETISASTNAVDIQRYTALNSVGLIEVTLKKGKPIEKVGEEMIDQGMDFKERQIATDNNQHDHDFRSTLWWERKIVNSNEQNSNFIYYNSELNSDVQGRIYFIPKSGIPSTTYFSYSVK